jgi:hypothetical protein
MKLHSYYSKYNILCERGVNLLLMLLIDEIFSQTIDFLSMSLVEFHRWRFLPSLIILDKVQKSHTHRFKTQTLLMNIFSATKL